MHDYAVEAVGPVRADRAPRSPLGAEHEVVDDELRASGEQLGQRPFAVLGIEDVLLVDGHPGEFPAAPGQLVTLAAVRLLCLEQCQAGLEVFLLASNRVCTHFKVSFGSVGARGGALRVQTPACRRTGRPGSGRARRSVTRQVDRTDEHDRVRVAASAAVGIVELVVDPPGAADLVVDCARKPSCHRLSGFASQYTGAVDRGGLPGRAGNVVIELLGCGQSHPLG
jgi:hypothetical protein